MACSSSAQQPFQEFLYVCFRFQIAKLDQLGRFNQMFLFERRHGRQGTGVTRRGCLGRLQREVLDPGAGGVELLARFGFDLGDVRLTILDLNAAP